jgi:hypothetical protein
LHSNLTPIDVIAALTRAFGPPITHTEFAAWSFGAVPARGRRPLNLWVPLVRRGGVCEAWIFPRDGSDLVSRSRTDLRSPRELSALVEAVRAARETDLAEQRRGPCRLEDLP